MKRLGVVVLGFVFLCCFGVTTVNATPVEDGINWEISGEGFHPESGNEVFFSGSGTGMVGDVVTVDIYYEQYAKALSVTPTVVIGEVELTLMTTGFGISITDFGASAAMDFGLKGVVGGLNINSFTTSVSNIMFPGFSNAMITGVTVGGGGLSGFLMGMPTGPSSVTVYSATPFGVMGTAGATFTYTVDLGQPDIPEPTTMALLGAGAAGLIVKRRRMV